jgi:GLPGLI family protein
VKGYHISFAKQEKIIKMRILLLLSVLLLLITVSFGQEITSGKVTYQQVIQLEIKLEGQAAQYADMIPKERKTEKVLWFDAASTLYENSQMAPPEDITAHQGGGNVMIRVAEPENKIYTDLATGMRVEQRDFMTRLFLIEDHPEWQWKITGNQKIILDYPCMEAVSGDGDKKVTAWFTPVIPVSSGPGTYGGLPGLILELETGEGKQLTTAVVVDTEGSVEGKIVKPDKGKKVTRGEFDTIVEEKMKEMGAQPGAGGHQMMIRIQR